MPLISACVNVDTRPENDTNQQMFNGVVSRDFIFEALENKRKLFEGYDFELVVFVDEHEILTEKELLNLKAVSDTLIIRRHNKKFNGQHNVAYFNDMNYINTLSCCRGKYIFHFDGDVAAFARDSSAIQEQIDLLETYDYISYPSLYSPYPAHDETWQGKFWVSTRYFCCKRETINISEIIKCQLDYDYWKEKYPMPRICHWTEHIIASHSWNGGKGVYYPALNVNKFILFTWENYHKYTLNRLNNQSFDEVREWFSKQDYHYPNNLSI